MKISIVTISYNQAPFLQTCIDSVAVQKGSWEHIIVDPGSTDGSRDIIRDNKAHFSRIVFERDDGPADGLKKGFALATGTHGFFLNSDDFILPNAFSILSELVSLYSRSDIFLCGGWLVDIDGQPLRRIRPTRASLRSLFDGSSTMFQQGMLFSMSAYNAVCGFNNKNRVCWDFELLCDLISGGYEVTHSDQRVGAFRIYPGTISDPASAGYKGKLEEQLDLIFFKLTGRERSAIYANPTALAKRYLRNPWLLREALERGPLRARLKKIWLRDMGKDV